MTILTSFILVVGILIIAALISYFFQTGQPLYRDLFQTEKEAQEIINEIKTIAEDVTSTVVKDKKTAETVVKADVDKVVKLAKVLPKEAELDIAAVKKSTKKKYYPKSPKGKS